MLSVKIVFVSGFTLFFSFFMVGCSHQLYQLHADMLEWQDQFILWYSLRCTGTWSYFWLLPCFSLGVHCFVSPSRLQTGEHTTNQSHCFRINCDDANEQSKNDQKLQNSEKERVPLGSKSPYKPPYKEDVIWCAGVQPYLISFSTL